MDEQNYILTQQGYDEAEEELRYRVNVRRAEIADKIETATALGDLSENAAYSEALNDQQMNEVKILQLTDLVQNAKVSNHNDTSTIGVGSYVMLNDMTNNKEYQYQIVGEEEANPVEFKISHTSPLGSIVMGKKVNDVVLLELVDNKVKYKVTKISNKKLL